MRFSPKNVLRSLYIFDGVSTFILRVDVTFAVLKIRKKKLFFVCCSLVFCVHALSCIYFLIFENVEP